MAIKLNWFKMLWLNSDERKALREAQALEGRDWVQAEQIPDPVEVSNKPYVNIIYSPSNKIITVVLLDGTVLTKDHIERPVYQKVKDATTQLEIEDLLIDKIMDLDPHKETEQDRLQIKDNLYVFRNNPDFEVTNNQVFLKPAKLALPAVVAATFIEIIEKTQAAYSKGVSAGEGWELKKAYETLKAFWLLLCTNPLAKSREDVLTFVKKNNVRLTKNGNMILYRRIVKEGKEDTSMVKLISQEYFKVKKWKKNPANYWLWIRDGKYHISSSSKSTANNPLGKKKGNLKKLYDSLPSMKENTYTSWHNKGDKKIKIGSIYYIDEKDINLDNGICAAGGLHAAAVDYDYSSFGDTPIVVLVNPSKAITVPRDETGKLRTTEMFVACINDKKQGEHYDEDSLDVFDDEYHNLTIKELEDAVKDKSFESLSVKGNKPVIDMVNIEEIKDALKNRIKQVV